MLRQRILATIKFFDLQNYPLTLLEIERFLIADPGILKQHLDGNLELTEAAIGPGPKVSAGEILKCLDGECGQEVGQLEGFYFLSGHKQLVVDRLDNYFYGIKREKLITRFLFFIRHIPFVRSVSIGGSQAMGVEKATSDIDLLIITEKNFLWIARTLVTFYFQVLGLRRHGNNIADRFCLNHYLSEPELLSYGHDAYNAMEFLRLRKLIYPEVTGQFQEKNSSWILTFFPNAELQKLPVMPQSRIQIMLEACFKNAIGRKLEKLLKNWQLSRIRSGDYVVAEPGEIAFHSKLRKKALLRAFF